MEVIAIVVAWYLSSCVGSILYFGVLWREELDVDVEDMLFGLGMGVLGPFNLIVAIIATLSVFIKRVVGWCIPMNTVVWRRK